MSVGEAMWQPRFLQLAANDEIRIAQPSTPASYFHLLRKQALDSDHRPLIVFTPKQLLRRKTAVSQPEDFTEGEFRRVLGDAVDPYPVRRVLLASGRIAYDLMEERVKREGDAQRTAILRVEQLYPLPEADLREELAMYPGATEIRWVQDEPENQGPWPYYALHLRDKFALPLSVVSRPESATTSVGTLSVHQTEARDLMNRAFD